MKRVALLLGINKYRDPGIQDLQCAGNDAGAVKEMLDENGFETHLLCDEEVILNNVTGKIKEICKQLCAGDLFLFYFSGHGHEIGDNHYLLCHGAIRVTLDINAGGDAVPLAAVRLLSESGCKTGVYRLFVLDCCRSSVLAGTKGGVGFTGRGIELVAENDHGGYIPPVILRSCGAGQQAYEDQKRGHGFFSLALLDAVQQKTVCSFDTFFRSVTNKLTEFIHPEQQRATLTDFSGRPLPLFPHWAESHAQPHPQPQAAVSDDARKLLLELLLEAQELEAKSRELGIDLNSNAEYQRKRKLAALADQRKDWENAASYLAQASQIARPLISEAEARRKAEKEARRKAEEEARRKAEEEARRKAEEEARRKAQIWLDARKQGLKFSDDQTVLLGCDNKELQEAVIPEGVTRIGAWAFKNCSSLTSVTIPEGVTEIGNSAFNGCSSLTSVTIPEGVTEIGVWAFSDCDSLTSVTIPEGVTEIGESAFNGCSSLTSVTIPASVNIVGEDAFKGVPCLKQLEKKYPHLFPKAEEEARRKAEEEARRKAEEEARRKAEEEARRKAQIWLDARKQGLKFSDDQTVLLGCDNKELQEAVIPEGVTRIGAWAFKNCSSLTSVTIPEGVTEIGNRAFWGCSSLTSVTIPKGVTEIGYAAFYGCSSLTSVTIPKGVTKIGDYAFSDCRSLTSVTIPEGVTEIGNSAFDDCISLTSVTIPESVTGIGIGAFYRCSSLTSVTIPEGVTEIGNSAFNGCISLTSVTIPEGVTEIGTGAFYGCSSLTSVTIPEGVTKIGDYAFYGCSSWTSVDLPGSVDSVGKEAFAGTPCEKELRKNRLFSFFRGLFS